MAINRGQPPKRGQKLCSQIVFFRFHCIIRSASVFIKQYYLPYHNLQCKRWLRLHCGHRSLTSRKYAAVNSTVGPRPVAGGGGGGGTNHNLQCICWLLHSEFWTRGQGDQGGCAWVWTESG